MSLSDARLVKGLLFGIFSAVQHNAAIGLLLAVVAASYTVAFIFTKDTKPAALAPKPEGGHG